MIYIDTRNTQNNTLEFVRQQLNAKTDRVQINLPQIQSKIIQGCGHADNQSNS